MLFLFCSNLWKIDATVFQRLFLLFWEVYISFYTKAPLLENNRAFFKGLQPNTCCYKYINSKGCFWNLIYSYIKNQKTFLFYFAGGVNTSPITCIIPFDVGIEAKISEPFTNVLPSFLVIVTLPPNTIFNCWPSCMFSAFIEPT